MRKRTKAALFFLLTILISQEVTVQAAEKPKVFMEVQEYSESEKTIKAGCMMKQGKDVTNGKLRLFYDAESLTLASGAPGESLSGAMHEVNDCLTGNKPEGEMIVVFAAAQPVASDGSLYDLEFELKDGVKEGDELTFRIEAEKLSGDNGDLEVETPEIVYTVGEGQTEKPGEQTGSGQTNGDKNSGGGADNGGRYTGSGGSYTSRPTSYTSGSSQSQNSGGGSSSKAGAVKTGDDTPIAMYLILGGGAVAVLIGAAAARGKKK